ncbi:RHS repeat-associated core domain-containing protein [Kitasatospora purpeofusca]|uniref:RHS repeat domain-containing protein n=1 Tax=Kitasatospora purpeofusca TaxID=67352 RepID=UPI002A5A1A87|nr:RHS repeat-associated core domain-containing protein [Kitasatospora purpeofusca]MDY0814717.1 RHS repeat-associated core domain-containing protein [Kitasatospora purpeofusca]
MKRGTVAVATAAVLSLVTPLAVADSIVGGYQYTDKVWEADPLPDLPKVPGAPADSRPGGVAAPAIPPGARELVPHVVKPVRWPAAATATVDLGKVPAVRGLAAPAGGAKAGDLPVSVSPAAPTALGARAKSLAPSVAPVSPVSSVRVKLADRGQAKKAGVDGLLVGLDRADARTDTGNVAVSLDYGAIEQAYGGGWASRLQLVAMPACALTTPQLAACRTRTPVEAVNDPVNRKLSGTVALVAAGAGTGAAKAGSVFAAPSAATAAAQSSAGIAVAAVAGSSGSQGDFGATSLSASGAWSASASGAFTYHYPVTVPPSLGGEAPAVSLSYDSQSVDGETSARNSQSSWIGDGWSYSPGFIERSYKSCKDQGIKDSGDSCWAGWNATLSLGSHSGQLVKDSDGLYHLLSDDGSRIERLSGATNGLWQGEYFKVTTTDGTAYYLGLNHAPGGTADDATDSAWGIPVYHPKSGDPCHSSDKGDDSQCDRPVGYRFNLDFVVDPHGNVQRYDWSTESNYYNMGFGQVPDEDKDEKGGTLTKYVRGGHLTRISYGYQLADARAGREPAAEVVFRTAQRCTTSDSVCKEGNLSSDTAKDWPDTPYDLNCPSDWKTKIGAEGDTEGVCLTSGPTFWQTHRLKGVDTRVRTSSGWQDVDTYELKQVFSDAGGTYDPVTGKTQDPKATGSLQSVMWLSEIVHTGKDTSAGGVGPISLDPVKFVGIEMDNRVDGLTPAAPPLYHPRMSSVQTETGESVAVTYRAPECSREKKTMPASADANTMACYPVFWNTPGGVEPIEDWFHKTLVSQVTSSDRTKAGSPAKVTGYTYSDGAAWHRDDSELTDDKHRTWNDFRGYRTVTTTTGAAPDPITQSTVSYLQGMDGDYRADGSKRTVKVKNVLDEEITDSAWMAGTPYQTLGHSQAGGGVVTRTLTSPPATTVTASVSRKAWTSEDPAPDKLSTLPDTTARRITSTSSRTMGLLSDGKWRTTRTGTTFDGYGRIWKADEEGDLSAPEQRTCTVTTYADAPSDNPMMLVYPKETISLAGPCGTVPGSTTTLSHKRVYYDGDGSVQRPGTLGVLGQNGRTLGNVTATEAVTSYDAAGKPQFQVLGAMTFDRYGRVTASTDAAGRTTTSSYDPPSGVLPTKLGTTNPLKWAASSTVSPGRGSVTHAVDVNNLVTDATYDALGRREKVWSPGRDKATQTPDRTYAYDVHGAGDNPTPSTVTTKGLREDGSYSTSVTIYDGTLQPRQTQSTPADNSAGRLVTSTYYDSHGWTVSSIGTYADAANAPSGTMWAEANRTGPSVTRTAFDGQGRPVTTTLVSFASTLWKSTSTYRGVDRVDTTPAQGGKAKSTYTDALGRTTATTVRDTTPDRKLDGGSRLSSGTSVLSAGVRLAMEADGNLVLTALVDNRTLWSASTGGHPGAYALMQADGNLAVLDATGKTTLWSSGTAGHAGGYLKVQADDNVAVYDAANVQLWSTGTANTTPAADLTTRYTYTPRGQIATVKDTVGNTWSYTYDLQGRTTGQSDPSTGDSSTGYDDLGQVVRTTDARKQSLSFSYDGLGRRTAEYAGDTAGDPAKLLAEWTYDSLGKGRPVASVRYVGGKAGSAYVQKFDGYNAVGQPTGTTTVIPPSEGALAGTYTAKASYTSTVGLLASSEYGAAGGLPAETVGYGYNLEGGLVSMGSPSRPYVATVQYSPLGQVLQTTLGTPTKQLRTAQTYDQATGRPATNRVSLQNNTANPISDTSYRYDQAGNVTAVSDVRSSGGTDRTVDTQCFGYDAQHRLVTAWTDTKGLTAATAGQVGQCSTARPTPSTVGGPDPYWLDWQFNRLGDRTQQVSHDVTGNAAKDTTQTLAYPGGGSTPVRKPTAVTSVTTRNPTAGTSVLTPGYDDSGNVETRTTTGARPSTQSFGYDAEGRTATVTTDGKQTGYLYDADGGLLLQRGPAGTTLYLFSGTQQLTLDAATRTVTGLRYYRAPDGTVTVRSGKGTISYQPTTPQGTAQLQVDGTTLAVTRRAFDPYGNPRGTAPGGWADNRGYLGRPTDTTSGLDLLGARQYDPVQGRFLQVDPVFEAGDPNQMGGYGYGAGNPTSGSDPNGLWWSWGDVGSFFTGVGDSIVGDPWQWSVNWLSDGWNSFADIANGDNDVFNDMTGYSNDSPFRLGHTGYVDDHPLANVFGVDTSSTSYVAGQWTGVVGSLLIDGYGAVKMISAGVKAVKAVKVAVESGDDVVSAVKKLLSGDLPTTTKADPEPTTPKGGDAPSTPKSGTGKGGTEPGGSGKSGAKSADEPAATPEAGNGGTKDGNAYRSKPDKKPNEYADGPVVSLGRLKQYLSRAGYRSEWDKYDVVHHERIIDGNTGELNYGNSPHTYRTSYPYPAKPKTGRNGLPIIEMSNKGLRNMREAVITFFHETHHQNRMRNYGDTGTEKDAEDFGIMMWRRISGQD